MRATKLPRRTVKRTKPRPSRGKAELLAKQVMALTADQVDVFVNALLPDTSAEFREDVSDLIVSEQRKDEPPGRLASDVFAELRAKDARRA